MDAAPSLIQIADAFAAVQLEAILIGNAGAALHGAPVTTMDFDFLYRVAPTNQAKLSKVAELLEASLSQPFPKQSSVFRIRRADPALQIDLMGNIHGVKSFHSVHSRASSVELKGRMIPVASLADIIKSKREANRPQDHAQLHVLEKTLAEIAAQSAQGPAPTDKA